MKNKIFIGVLFVTMFFVSCNFGVNNAITKNKYESNNNEIQKPNSSSRPLNIFGSFDAEKPKQILENYFIISTDASFDGESFTNKGFEIKGKITVRDANIIFWYIYAKDIKSLHAFKAIKGVTSASWETTVDAPDFTVNNVDSNFTDEISTLGITDDGKPDPVDNAQGYSLKNTKALDAYKEFGYGPNENIVYAGIIDTGTNMRHVDLEDVVLYAKSCANSNPINGNEEANPENTFTEIPLGENWDKGGHGTHCSGTICAKYNGKAINGVAWKNVKLISYQGLGAKGGGSSWAIYGAMIDLVDTVEILRKDPNNRTTDEIVALPSYLQSSQGNIQIKQKTVPVNMSLGGSGGSAFNFYAMTYAMEHNVLPVIAMGNEGAYTNSYPAALPGMLSVGAIDGKDVQASFSTRGSWINICAPGVGIESCLNNTPYTPGSLSEETQNMSGTSMATPFITGTIAYLLSFDNARDLKPYQIITLLEKTADKIDGLSDWSDKYGYGRVNVYNAAKAIKDNEVPSLNEKYTEAKLTITATNNGKNVSVPNVLITDGNNIPVVCLPGDIGGKPYVIKGLKMNETYTVKCNFGGDVASENVTIRDSDQNTAFTFNVPIAYVSTVKSLHYNGGNDAVDTAIVIYEEKADGSVDLNSPILEFDEGYLDTVSFRYEKNKNYYAMIKAFIDDAGSYRGGNYVIKISDKVLDNAGSDITDGNRTESENDSHEDDNNALEAKSKGDAWDTAYACNLVSPGQDPSTGKPIEDYDWFYFEAK